MRCTQPKALKAPPIKGEPWYFKRIQKLIKRILFCVCKMSDTYNCDSILYDTIMKRNDLETEHRIH